jgi:hypothetical protein
VQEARGGGDRGGGAGRTGERGGGRGARRWWWWWVKPGEVSGEVLGKRERDARMTGVLFASMQPRAPRRSASAAPPVR